MIPFPDKTYEIIYADPCWETGDRIFDNKQNRRFVIEDYYPTMSMNDLKALDIGSIAQKDCLLFGWILSPFMKECIDVYESWGFEYRTIAFIWHKKMFIWDIIRCQNVNNAGYSNVVRYPNQEANEV